ncbi:MAG: hypothetical protein V7731_15075 [Amphritea sp.]
MSLIAIILVLVSAFVHAGWNMMVKSRQASSAFLMASVTVGALCLLPVLPYYSSYLERISAQVWGLLIATGIAQTFYNMALGAAYRNGDLSIAYPIARAMPVLMVGSVTLIGSGINALSQTAIAGMLLIVAGTFLIPLTRFRHWHVRQYINIGCFYAILAALGTTVYSVIDSRALQLLRQDLELSAPEVSLLYLALMSLFSAGCFALTLLAIPSGRRQVRDLMISPKRPIILVGVGAVFTYGLVLTAMLYVDDVSYVVAFRQLSIPIGVILGLLLLKEQGGRPRLIGVALMFTGLMMVAIA